MLLWMPILFASQNIFKILFEFKIIYELVCKINPRNMKESN